MDFSWAAFSMNSVYHHISVFIWSPPNSPWPLLTPTPKSWQMTLFVFAFWSLFHKSRQPIKVFPSNNNNYLSMKICMADFKIAWFPMYLNDTNSIPSRCDLLASIEFSQFLEAVTILGDAHRNWNHLSQIT